MAQHPADLNLLYGILALQLDFISRDQLVAAMNAWVVEKSQSLGAILVGQQALAPERHTLLQALVQEHLKQHHNDPQQSLATVSSVGSVRRDLEQIAKTFDAADSARPICRARRFFGKNHWRYREQPSGENAAQDRAAAQPADSRKHLRTWKVKPDGASCAASS